MQVDEVATLVWQDVRMTATEPSRRIRQLRQKRERAQRAAEQATDEYHAGIAEMLRTKQLRVTDLVELSGYTREHIRRIARERGVAGPR